MKINNLLISSLHFHYAPTTKEPAIVAAKLYAFHPFCKWLTCKIHSVLEWDCLVKVKHMSNHSKELRTRWGSEADEDDCVVSGDSRILLKMEKTQYLNPFSALMLAPPLAYPHKTHPKTDSRTHTHTIDNATGKINTSRKKGNIFSRVWYKMFG